MRRSIAVAPWVTCALLALALPATAQKKSKKKQIAVHKCVKYSQSEYESGYHLKLASTCDARVTCELRWQLECEDEDPRYFAEAFSLDDGDAHRADADAAICGDAAWSVSNVKWTCDAEEP